MVSASDVIANRYQLERQIGAGSYADTWLAEDLVLDRKVAVKVLRPQFQAGDDDQAMFRREAHTAASISHPNVVATFDAGMTDGLAYLVMEYVDGINLKQEIRARVRLDPDRAMSVADDLLRGLSRIHAAGIIHRDVKPQNVLVSPSGASKLTDFGIAGSQDETARPRRHTTVGSAAYMAPEQALGHPVSPAADIYAVGVVLYEMLTGRLPFFGDDPHRVIEQHVSRAVTPPRRFNPRIPIPVERVVLRALAKRPEDRYQSADDMREELRDAQIEDYQHRNAVPAAVPTGGTGSRFLWVAAAAVMMVTLLAGSTAIAVRDFSTSSPLSSNYFGSVSGDEDSEPPQPEPTEAAIELILDYDLEATPEDETPVDRPAPTGPVDSSNDVAEGSTSDERTGEDQGDTDSSTPSTGGTGGSRTQPEEFGVDEDESAETDEPEADESESSTGDDDPAESASDADDEQQQSSNQSEQNDGSQDEDGDDQADAPENTEDPPTEPSDDSTSEPQETPVDQEHEQQEEAQPQDEASDSDGDPEDSTEDGDQPEEQSDPDQGAQEDSGDAEQNDEEQAEEEGQREEEEQPEEPGQDEAEDQEPAEQSDEQGQDEAGAEEPAEQPSDEESEPAEQEDGERDEVLNPDNWSWAAGGDAPSIDEMSSEFWSVIEKYEESGSFDWDGDSDVPDQPADADDSSSESEGSEEQTDDGDESSSGDEGADEDSEEVSRSDGDDGDDESSDSDRDSDDRSQDRRHEDGDEEDREDREEREESSDDESWWDRDHDDDGDRNDEGEDRSHRDEDDDEDEEDEREDSDDRENSESRSDDDDRDRSRDDDDEDDEEAGDDRDEDEDNDRERSDDNSDERDDRDDDDRSQKNDRSRNRTERDLPGFGTFARHLPDISFGST